MLHEYCGNLHTHTRYSDGAGSHNDIALAAMKAGLDFVVVTDHNVYVRGLDGYRTQGANRILLLVGEEVHDQARDPQKNHLLVYETQQEVATHASDPQLLLDEVNAAGGIAFLAHPVDPAAPLFKQPDLSWVDWDVQGYVGIELWNFMSEFKSYLTSTPRALYYALQPEQVAQAPYPEAIRRWDHLLRKGKKIVAIGGSDAHAMRARMGPLNRELFPYEFHFRTINTHILTPEPLVGKTEPDRERIFNALRQGHCFIGHDLPASTKGFRFAASGDEGQAIMGDCIRSRFGVTLQAKSPQPAKIRLICNGQEVHTWERTEAAVLTVQDSGAYRIEVSIPFKGKLRGWIYSNPIYVTC